MVIVPARELGDEARQNGGRLGHRRRERYRLRRRLWPGSGKRTEREILIDDLHKLSSDSLLVRMFVFGLLTHCPTRTLMVHPHASRIVLNQPVLRNMSSPRMTYHGAHRVLSKWQRANVEMRASANLGAGGVVPHNRFTRDLAPAGLNRNSVQN